eukprot:COSAG01_NODE_54626_length_330_cov_55.242424_1_plen_44_part_10
MGLLDLGQLSSQNERLSGHFAMLLLPAGRPGSVEFSESNQQAAE